MRKYEMCKGGNEMMNLSFDFIKSISNIYDEMRSNGFSLVYLGEFSHEITKMFTSMAESDMVRKNEDRTVQRKVFHVMVETIQNMNKHSDETIGDIGNGLFVIGKKDDTYYIITSNRVGAAHKANLERALDTVNRASSEELKAMFKEQMVSGEMSHKGGAGLGLIDIRRKTGSNLDYEFLTLNEDSYFFILKVEVNAKKLVKE